MIPGNHHRTPRPRRGSAGRAASAAAGLALAAALTATAVAAAPLLGAPVVSPATDCLPTGDGYFRARLAGELEARIDWPNSGTRCQGETKINPPGVRLSFQRNAGAKPDLLFVFGLTGIRPGQPAHATGANVTVIVQGTSKIYGTLGDSRCTVDSLTQRPMPTPGTYRIEARGFCTQPAHAVRGNGDVLVSTFEFAGMVNYGSDAPASSAAAAAPHHAP